MHIRVLMICLLAMTSAADAQLGVPSRLPDLPAVSPQAPLEGAELLADRLDRRLVQEVERARRESLDALLRANRDVLERGPRGSVVLRGEVMVVDPASTLLEEALPLGFTLVEDRTEGALGLRYLRLHAPGNMSAGRALRVLQRLDPDSVFDLNSLYFPSGHASGNQAAHQPATRDSTRIGMIDAGVPSGAPYFLPGQVEARAFRGLAVVPRDHGLQVASIIGSGGGVVPGAHILAADVYGDQPTGGAVDTIVRALGWMAALDVRVVNISIVGPENRVLEAAIERFTAQGRLVVAAVGNDGANAGPLYPAGYPPVVAVTGVNAANRVLPEAVQGDHVDFAARGMDMNWPSLAGAGVPVRGTSFASPIVAGMLARQLNISGSGEAALAILAARATDLGRHGRDSVYGFGLLDAPIFESRTARRSDD